MAVARAWDADTDPAADTALSPWIWVPLIFLVFACLLFVSFRRAKAFELVDRFTTACREKLPWTKHLLPAQIQLSHADVELPDDGSDDDEDADERRRRLAAARDTEDELPSFDSRPPVPGVLERTRIALFGPSSTPASSGADSSGAGIASAFWGSRHGRVRLGAQQQYGAASVGDTSELSGWRGALERMTDLAGSSRRSSRPFTTSGTNARAGQSQTSLFNLAEDDDAEELDADALAARMARSSSAHSHLSGAAAA